MEDERKFNQLYMLRIWSKLVSESSFYEEEMQQAMINFQSISVRNGAFLFILLLLTWFQCNTGIQAQETTTSSLRREYITVLDVGLLSTSPQQNSTLDVVGQLSTRASQEP